MTRPSSGLSAGISRLLSWQKVTQGRMRGPHAKILNVLAFLLVIAATLMLGKSCWIMLKAEVAQVLLDRAFAHSIVTGKNVKPWRWADTWPVARVQVARLNAEAIVLNGSTTEALAFGPTWLPDTSKPGEPGTAVFAAHRDTHFAFLKHIAVDDEIRITRSDGLTFSYVVRSMRVAKWNASGINRNEPGHHLVLSTCYPLDGTIRGDDRFIVEAEMVR